MSSSCSGSSSLPNPIWTGKKEALQSLSSTRPANFRQPAIFCGPRSLPRNRAGLDHCRDRFYTYPPNPSGCLDCCPKRAMCDTESDERRTPNTCGSARPRRCNLHSDTRSNSGHPRLGGRTEPQIPRGSPPEPPPSPQFHGHPPKRSPAPRYSNPRNRCTQISSRRDTRGLWTYRANDGGRGRMARKDSLDRVGFLDDLSQGLAEPSQFLGGCRMPTAHA